MPIRILGIWDEPDISEINLVFHNVATRAPRWPGPTTKSSDELVFSMMFWVVSNIFNSLFVIDFLSDKTPVDDSKIHLIITA